jgi:SSS family solute:Na+ symporter
VVPRAAESGQGLVPARLDPATGKPLLGADGRALLDYAMASPNMLARFLPTGLLGLGLAALLACLMSGVAASVAAFNTVFTYGLYASSIRKGASDGHYLAVGRWAAVGCVLLSAAAACAILGFNGAPSGSIALGGIVAALLLLFSVVNLPQLAVLLLGMFSRRATGHGAFAGLIAGAAAALLHHGLTLPTAAHPGLCGGWIAALYRYPGPIAQGCGTAVLAFGVSLLVASAVSLRTRPRPQAELVGLVRSLTRKPKRAKVWWKRPEALAVAILLAAIAVGILLAC